MADYNEDGSVVETVTDAPVDTGVSSDVVTILAPSLPSLLGLLMMIGAVWYFSAHSQEYFREDG
jgi:hypothetical protein